MRIKEYAHSDALRESLKHVRNFPWRLHGFLLHPVYPAGDSCFQAVSGAAKALVALHDFHGYSDWQLHHLNPLVFSEDCAVCSNAGKKEDCGKFRPFA